MTVPVNLSQFLQKALNGTDIPSPSTFLANLGGAAASAMLQKANNLSDLASAAAALTNLGIARGQASVTFSASVVSSSTVVSHGLGVTPSAVVVTVVDAGGFGVPVTGGAGSYNGSTFTLIGRTPSSVTATITFAWIAIR